jgi:hypothetical protein
MELSASSVAWAHIQARDALFAEPDPEAAALDLCIDEFNGTGMAKSQAKYKMSDLD